MKNYIDARTTFDEACKIAVAALGSLEALKINEEELKREKIDYQGQPLSERDKKEIEAFVTAPIASACVRAVFRHLTHGSDRHPDIPPKQFLKSLMNSGEVGRIQKMTGLSRNETKQALSLTSNTLLESDFFSHPREIRVRAQIYIVRNIKSNLHVEIFPNK